MKCFFDGLPFYNSPHNIWCFWRQCHIIFAEWSNLCFCISDMIWNEGELAKSFFPIIEVLNCLVWLYEVRCTRGSFIFTFVCIYLNFFEAYFLVFSLGFISDERVFQEDILNSSKFIHRFFVKFLCFHLTFLIDPRRKVLVEVLKIFLDILAFIVFCLFRTKSSRNPNPSKSNTVS